MKLKLIKAADFNKLTNAQKRVAIARDVLARINAKLIKPKDGIFFSNKYDIEDGKTTVKTFVNKTQCSVCAKGALFCSWVGNFNNFDKEDLWHVNEELGEKFPEELLNIFGRVMLDSIEYNFEGCHYDWICKEAVALGSKYGYCHNLEAIMENIIDNNGEFVID